MKASRLALTLLLLANAPSCSSRSVKGGDASSTNDVGQTRDVGQASDVRQANDVAPEIPADAVIVPPDNVTFPAAPEIACGGDSTECPFPPSACADRSCDGGVCPGEAWVVYYDTPTCVDGKCAYTKKYFRCDFSSICAAGGCRFNGTAGRIPKRMPSSARRAG